MGNIRRETKKSQERHNHPLGPLQMSPVTGLARLPGRLFWSVHMGNFSTVDRAEIQETQA